MEYLDETPNRYGQYVTKNLPLAVSICLAESKDEYAFAYWTVARAGLDLNSPEYNIVHDRGKAVIAARAKALPKAHSFHCDQHVFRNIQALPGVGDLQASRPAFMAMTQATTEEAFNNARAKVCSKLPPNAVKYVLELDPALISAYHFRMKTGKAISFTNTNPVEAENWRLLPARWATHPLEALLDVTKIWGTTFAIHQEIVKRELREHTLDDVVGNPKILPVVKRRAMGTWKMAQAAKLGCKLSDANSSIVRVTTVASLGDTVNVNLDQHKCDCGKYEENQYPCVHALAAAKYLKFRPEDYFELFAPMFYTENIVLAHTKSILTPSRVHLRANPLERIEPSVHFVRECRRAGRPSQNKRARSTGEL